MQKQRKFYIDWWNIKKSTIYGLVAFVVIALVITGVSWWGIRHNWFAQPELTDIPKDAARILSFEGDVRVIRASTRETIVVTKATYVAAGDTIQTQSDGKAKVQMIDGSIYSLGPNSTVIVRDSTSIFGGRNIRVSLDDGQMNVKTEEQAADTENVVEVQESENKLLSQTDASFNADAETNGGEIRISRGGVETTIAGQKTVIRENEYAALNNGAITTREKLLEPPAQSSPANLAQIVDSSGQGVNITFNWQDAGTLASSYSLQVSRSPFFASDAIMIDRASLTTRDFRMGGLSPGTYYWRLKATAKSGQATGWNEPWKFTIVRPEAATVIEAAEWKVEPVGGGIYIVSARTQSGMTVSCQGRQTFAGPDGTFRLQISAPGSDVTVEIGDGRGNRIGYNLSLRTSKASRRY
jgi:FecR protein